MSKHQHHKKRNYTLHYLLILAHRWMGFSIAIFILLLAITGIMLNHTEQLSLSKKHIESPLILSWYGIKMPNRQTYFKLNQTNFVQLGESLYFDNKLLTKDSSQLNGISNINDLIIIATAQHLYLLTAEGELIEKLSPENGLPTPINELAISNKGQLLIMADTNWYTSNDDYLSWSIVNDTKFKVESKNIAKIHLPNQTTLKYYQDLYLGNSFPIERFILDIHSGRIMTEYGVALMDLVAILMILLTISGSYIWVKRTLR
jgi:hypothetical protein